MCTLVVKRSFLFEAVIIIGHNRVTIDLFCVHRKEGEVGGVGLEVRCLVEFGSVG